MLRCTLLVLASVAAATAVASAVPAKPNGTPSACRALDLHRDPFPVFQPAGSAAEGVIRITSRRACVLPRRIEVRFIAPAHRQRVRYGRQRLFAGEVPVRTIRPHRTVLLRVMWENWCGPGSNSLGVNGAPPRALVIGRAGTSPLFRLPVNGAPPCYVPSRPSTVGVTPFFRVAHAIN